MPKKNGFEPPFAPLQVVSWFAFPILTTAFYGLTIGYKKRLKKGFGIEFFIGAGLAQSWYKGYKGLRRVDLDNPDETVYRPFNGSGEVVAYRGGLMLTYKIPIFATKINSDE